jgi:dipeptidyl aminopeptidase/acylaminoacyl peptidase
MNAYTSRRSVLVVLTVLVAALATPAYAAFPGDDGVLAYRADRAGASSYRIYLRAATGGAETPITPDGEDASYPTWAPDGSRIAYAFSPGGSDSEIYVARADGANPRPLTDSPAYEFSPRFSPDGTRVAFIKGEPAAVWVVKVNGTGLQKLATLGGDGQSFSWSPDGRSLVVTIYRAATRGNIAVVNLATGKTRLLTSSDANDVEPDWAPSGTRFVFSREVGSQYELFVMNADGTGLQRLTHTPDLDETQAAWSPSGKRIVFVHRIVATNDRDLATMAPKVDAPEKLVGSIDGDDFDPAWQPLCTQTGTSGDDVLKGTNGRDLLCGLGGDDTLIGYGANDALFGGPGKDTLKGGPGPDVLAGGPGTDTCVADAGDLKSSC